MSPRVFSEVLALCLATVVVVTLGLLTKSLNAASVYGEYHLCLCFYFPLAYYGFHSRVRHARARHFPSDFMLTLDSPRAIFFKTITFSIRNNFFSLQQLFFPPRCNFCQPMKNFAIKRRRWWFSLTTRKTFHFQRLGLFLRRAKIGAINPEE